MVSKESWRREWAANVGVCGGGGGGGVDGMDEHWWWWNLVRIKGWWRVAPLWKRASQQKCLKQRSRFHDCLQKFAFFREWPIHQNWQCRIFLWSCWKQWLHLWHFLVLNWLYNWGWNNAFFTIRGRKSIVGVASSNGLILNAWNSRQGRWLMMILL